MANGSAMTQAISNLSGSPYSRAPKAISPVSNIKSGPYAGSSDIRSARTHGSRVGFGGPEGKTVWGLGRADKLNEQLKSNFDTSYADALAKGEAAREANEAQWAGKSNIPQATTQYALPEEPEYYKGVKLKPGMYYDPSKEGTGSEYWNYAVNDVETAYVGSPSDYPDEYAYWDAINKFRADPASFGWGTRKGAYQTDDQSWYEKAVNQPSEWF